jgi:hypothetical protein
MKEEAAKIAGGLIVLLWVAALFLWAKPFSGYGRLSRALLAANAGGWLLLLSVAGVSGHPPPVLFWALLFWLLNLLLLPVTSTILWLCRKDAGERKSYLAVAFAYVVANVLALYVVPVSWAYLH